MPYTNGARMQTYTCTRIYLTHASAAAAAPSLGTISSLKGPEPAKSANFQPAKGPDRVAPEDDPVNRLLRIRFEG